MEGDKGGLALGGSGVPYGSRGLDFPDPWERAALKGNLQGNWEEEEPQSCVSTRRVSVR